MNHTDSILIARRVRIDLISQELRGWVPHEVIPEMASRIDRAILPATYGSGVGVGEIPPAKGV